MVDRVLLGKRTDNTYGLDISKPGIDVKSAANNNMIFTTRWGHSGVVHQTGLINLGQTVSFPTLPYVPLATCSPIVSGSAGQQFMIYQLGSGNYSGYSSSFVQNGYECYWQVNTNSITTVDLPVWSLPNPYPGNLAPPSSYQMRYIIFRIPGGV